MSYGCEQLWCAIEARDSRFDGWVFLGVATTGVYCRPSCPARTPKRANMRFFPTAAAAEAAGFRACMRCRPDVAPGSPDSDRRADLVERAMRLIAEGVVDREGVAGLARRLGHAPGHVHRQLVAVAGVGPVALARAQRAQSASDGSPADGGAITLRLPCRSPYDGEATLAFLAPRSVTGVEEVVGGVYRRSLRLAHGHGIVELEPADAHVRARFLLDDFRDLATAMQRSRAMLDLDSDPEVVLAALACDPLLAPLVRASPGRRVVGHVDAHELAIRAVLGQQVSVAGARTVTARLVAAHGDRLARPIGSVTHVFPPARTIATIDPGRLPMPGARRAALQTLARSLADGRVTLDPGPDRHDARRRLLELPGIGPWTAEYIAMRALRDPDAFMASDLGVRHALTALGQDGRPAAATRLAERWRPYRAYALAHLWASLA